MDEAPLGLSRDGIAIDAAQVTLEQKMPVVAEEVIERTREALHRARRVLIVESDRLAEFVADAKELGFTLPLRLVLPYDAAARDGRTRGGDGEEHRKVGVAPLHGSRAPHRQLTTASKACRRARSPRPRFSRRRPRRSSGPRAESRPRRWRCAQRGRAARSSRSASSRGLRENRDISPPRRGACRWRPAGARGSA